MGNRAFIPVMAIIFTLLAIFLLMFSAKIAVIFFISGVLGGVIFFYPFQGLLIYLMMTYLRPQEFIPALKDTSLMLILALALLGILVLHSVVRKKPFHLFNPRQGAYMVAFFAAILLSQLQRFYLTGTREAFDDFLPVFLLFFMILNLTNDFRQLKKAFLLLFFMTLFLSLNGILQYYRGYDIAGQTMFQDRIRWIGIFSDPNDLGLTILAFTPVAVFNLFSRKKSKLRRALWLISLLILVTALYFTNSRGTFVGLLAIAVLFLCRRIGVARGLVIGAALAAASFLAGPGRMSDMSLDEASASGRIDAWATGLNLLKWRPVLGVGFHNFTEHHPLTAHNSVVLCMSELGLVGLYIWLLMFVSSFTETIQVRRIGKGTEFADYAEIMQMSLVGFFVSAFFLSRTYNEVLFILISLCSLISLFARESFGYVLPVFSRPLLLKTVLFMAGLIVLIKILVMI